MSTAKLVSRETPIPVDVQRPILCLVTDRTRLDARADGGLDRLLVLVRIAGVAGVDLVQIRENNLDDQTLVDLVGQAVEVTQDTSTRIIVNDRVDLALAAGAAGVHLKSTSFSAERIRPMVPPGWVIGRSVHGLDEAVQVSAAGGLDYVTYGTVFKTASKPGGRPTGLDVLGRVAAVLSLPVLAIGGITVDRARGVARSGAAGLAAIGVFAAAAESTETFRALVAEMRNAFTTSATSHD